MRRDRKILRLALHTAWALEPRVFGQLVRIVQRHASGKAASAEDLAAAQAGMRERAQSGDSDSDGTLQVAGMTAIVPIRGVITPHGSLVDELSGPGSASIDGIAAQLAAAVADPNVRSILLDVDSPGGSVDGVSELAASIRAARARKRVVALANTNALSAAYWLAAQADEFFATSGARVGSIGIVMSDVDERRALESQGVDVKLITSNELKNASVSQPAVSTNELRSVTNDVQAFHDLFVEDIAAGRGMDIAAASALATGAVEVGKQAVTKGFVDGVTTFEALLADLNLSNEASMKKPQTPTSGEAAGEKVGGRKKGGTRAEGDTVVNVQVPAAPEGAEEDEEEEDEEEGAEGEKPKEEAKSSTTAAVTKQPRLSAELLAEGARIERERVRAIRAMTRPGLEPTIEALCESGASPEDAARAIEVAAKSLTGKRLDDLRASAVEETITGAAPAPKAATAKVPKEWAEEWRELSANFDGNVESFLAFKEAEKGGRLRAAGRGA